MDNDSDKINNKFEDNKLNDNVNEWYDKKLDDNHSDDNIIE